MGSSDKNHTYFDEDLSTLAILGCRFIKWLDPRASKTHTSRFVRLHMSGEWNATCKRIKKLQWKLRCKFFFCKSIWSNSTIRVVPNVLAFRQLGVQIWHHDLSFVGQFRIAALVTWDQPRCHFRDLGAGEVGQLPVEGFTVVGPRTDQMLDPSSPKITGPNEVLVKIAKNMCSILQLCDQQGTCNQQVQDEHPVS